MFSLVFLVMFGPKKGSVSSYIGAWEFKFNLQLMVAVYTRVLNNRKFSLDPY